MAKGGLTPKQEKFVQNLVKGMSQREAYKKSYNAKKMKDASIDTKAWELMQKVEIRERYDELMGKAESKAVMSAQQRMEWLTNIINEVVKEKTAVLKTDKDGNSELIEQEFPSKLDTKLKALDILNKMSGEYKTILDGNVEVTKKLEDLL